MPAYSQFSSFTQMSSAMTTPCMDRNNLEASLTISQKLSQIDPNVVDLCVTVHPPKEESRYRGPADICCVIDVSASMSKKVNVDEAEDTGLTVLDLVKHSVTTVMQTLNYHDRLSVVTFSDNAEVVLDNIPMDDDGKEKAKHIVDALQPQRKTNLWGGLLEGMKLLNHKNNDRNTALFILTDGIPNILPSGGHIAAMRDFRDQNGGNYPGSIHTFGFGYKLQSDLLYRIATEGNGTYSFIPDAGMIGTVFVNTLANQLSVFGTQATLSLQLEDEDNTSFDSASLASNGSHDAASWGVIFNMGPLHFGQKRDYVVQVRVDSRSFQSLESENLVVANLQYQPLFTSSYGIKSEFGPIQINESNLDLSYLGVLNLEAQLLRATVIDALACGFAQLDTNGLEQLLQTWLAEKSSIRDSASAMEIISFVSELQRDVTGQIRIAHSEQSHFKRWGEHYLRSLRCAHQKQQCNNFKDPGVQNYGGILFKTIRDFADEVFVSTPSPQHATSSSSNDSSHVTPIDMRAFHNASAGCFAGTGQVELADGSVKLVCDVLAGDRVKCGNGNSKCNRLTAEVECVVRTECSQSHTAELVELENGLLLTPWHPVCIHDKWEFPMDIVGKSRSVKADFVYNFVLGNDSSGASRGQSVFINGVKCITLAHGIENDPVATHDFYGTDKVLKALQKFDGYEDGRVTMDETDVKRSQDTGLVCGFR